MEAEAIDSWRRTHPRARRVPLAPLMFSLLGCSAGVAEADSASRLGVAQDPAAPESLEPAPELQRTRVLVTGFNDWRELGEPPNVWRCRDNPSCRLLVGEPSTDEATPHDGPLVQRLRARAPEIEWRFATMPVTWEVSSPVPADVDVIINIGLGVYDRVDALQLEVGAYNLRRGTDAAGLARAEAIAPSAAEVLAAPTPSPIAAHIQALAGRTIAGFELLAAAARPDNSYLCNETHYTALTALHAGVGRLRAVYFLHIPYIQGGAEGGAPGDDYEPLADAVAEVVLSLAGPE